MTETFRTREECIQSAAEVYGAILSDPDRRAGILAHRARVASGRAATVQDSTEQRCA